MGRHVRAILRQLSLTALGGYLLLVLLSMPIWYALTLTKPYHLMARLWNHTWDKSITSSAYIPHTPVLTAGFMWLEANVDVRFGSAEVTHMPSFRMWQLWLYWAGHLASPFILFACFFWLLAITSYVWEPLVPRHWWGTDGVFANDGTEVRSPMGSLLNLITGDDLRGLSLYDTMWKRGSRQIALGVGLFTLGLLLAPFVLATKDPNWRQWGSVVGSGLFGIVLISGGQAIHTRAEALKRSDEQAELEHLRTLNLTDATKNTRGPRDYDFETQAQIRTLAHELTLETRRETSRENQRQHDKWRMVVNRMDKALQGLILAKTELRGNPLYEEIVKEFHNIYDLTKSLDPETEIDNTAMTEMLEQVLLADFAQRRGMNVRDFSGRH